MRGRDKREILHSIPLRYRIDRREWLRNPLGFSGDNLEAEFFTIDSDRYYLEDVLNLCNDVGLEVKKFAAESIASASVTLSDSEKEMGVALVDIGGGTADGIIFINGVPHHSFSIAVAGSLATQGLVIWLEHLAAGCRAGETALWFSNQRPEENPRPVRSQPEETAGFVA